MAFFTTKKTEKVFLAENAERCEKFRPFLYIQMFWRTTSVQVVASSHLVSLLFSELADVP